MVSLTGLVASVNPYMTYIKIGVAVLVVSAFVGLYAYAKHESNKVDSLNVEIGVDNKAIADYKADVKSWQHINDLWVAAQKKYESNVKAQNDALKNANATKDAINAELQSLKAYLGTNPPDAVERLNGDLSGAICLLNHASGGAVVCPRGPSAVTPGASGAPAPTTP